MHSCAPIRLYGANLQYLSQLARSQDAKNRRDFAAVVCFSLLTDSKSSDEVGVTLSIVLGEVIE